MQQQFQNNMSIQSNKEIVYFQNQGEEILFCDTCVFPSMIFLLMTPHSKKSTLLTDHVKLLPWKYEDPTILRC